jgi:hypothetical protein
VQGDALVVEQMLRDGVDAVADCGPLLLAADPVCACLLVKSRFGRALLLQRKDYVPIVQALLQKISIMEGSDVPNFIQAVKTLFRGKGQFRAALSRCSSGLKLFEMERRAQLEGVHSFGDRQMIDITREWLGLSDAEQALYESKAQLQSQANENLRASGGGRTSEEVAAGRVERLLADREAVVREWEGVRAQLNPPAWLKLLEETNGVISNCFLDAVRRVRVDLEGVEKAMCDGVDKATILANSSMRSELRLELRDLIVVMRPRVAAALAGNGVCVAVEAC